MYKVFCLGLLTAFALGAKAVEVDAIAAKVGTKAILKSDIVREMSRAKVADESAYAEFRNILIERELILSAAKDAKLTLQDWVVEDRIRDIIAKNFDSDRNRLVAALAEQKIPYAQWKNEILNDMIVAAMRWQTVDKNVSASPKAMKEEYEAHPEKYTKNRLVTVSVILLKPADADKRGEISKALKSESFSDLAMRYSSDSRASSGGLWADVNPEEFFKPEIVAEIDAMPKGTISRWIEIDGWSFLLRKEKESSASKMSFEEAYDMIERNVLNDLSQKLYRAWIERLKDKTYIKVY